MNRKIAGLALLTASLAGCGDAGPDIEQKPESQLTMVRFADTLFVGAQKTASFWAVKGENRELELRYADSSGPGGPEFLQFRVKNGSLLSRPDGTAFAQGDSIQISVTVDAAGRFAFDFQPSGLRFDPAEPAELEINFEHANRDLNGDGVFDAQDAAFKERLSIWKQETPASDWLKLVSLRIREDELRADVTGFTGFALAN